MNEIQDPKKINEARFKKIQDAINMPLYSHSDFWLMIDDISWLVAYVEMKNCEINDLKAKL